MRVSGHRQGLLRKDVQGHRLIRGRALGPTHLVIPLTVSLIEQADVKTPVVRHAPVKARKISHT